MARTTFRPAPERTEDEQTVRIARKRFARRQWARRWLAWRGLTALFAVLALVGGAVWLVFFSSVLAVTDADIGVMEAVVGTIRAERGDEPEPTAGDAAWRHRLMSLGHDPLRPT